MAPPLSIAHPVLTPNHIMFRSMLASALITILPLAAQARSITATVYDSWYNGRVAYCGSVYRHWGISAAHPWLPCGTRVRVFHGGRSLMVPITDRCECNSIDLSAGAAYKLGVPLDGTATVNISY